MSYGFEYRQSLRNNDVEANRETTQPFTAMNKPTTDSSESGHINQCPDCKREWNEGENERHASWCIFTEKKTNKTRGK